MDLIIKVAVVFFLTVISSCENQSRRKNNTDNSPLTKTGSANEHVDRIPIPLGYDILDSATGYLNADTIKDIIVILKRHNEDSLSNQLDSTIDRIFLILEGTTDRKYIVSGRNNNAVYTLHSGGARYADPYYKTTIENQRFTITHLYGGGPLISERHITFEFSVNDNNWIMTQDEYRNIDLNEVTNDSTPIENYQKIEIKRPRNNEKILFTDFNIYKENY